MFQIVKLIVARPEQCQRNQARCDWLVVTFFLVHIELIFWDRCAVVFRYARPPALFSLAGYILRHSQPCIPLLEFCLH
jgi:hypothetical protein